MWRSICIPTNSPRFKIAASSIDANGDDVVYTMRWFARSGSSYSAVARFGSSAIACVTGGNPSRASRYGAICQKPMCPVIMIAPRPALASGSRCSWPIPRGTTGSSWPSRST